MAKFTTSFHHERTHGEHWCVTSGLLNRIAVSIVHTETQDEIRIISFRKATTKEKVILFQSLED